MLAALDLRPIAVTSLQYSLDVGISWSACQLSSVPFRVTGLFTHPMGADTRLLAVGVLNSTTSVAVLVDMRAVHTRDCVGWQTPTDAASDYELWLANWEHCVMGRRVTYVRRKRSAACRSPAAFQNNTYSIVNCECVRDDFVCANCFRLDEDGKCVPDTTVCANPRPAPTPCVGFYGAPSGFAL